MFPNQNRSNVLTISDESSDDDELMRAIAQSIYFLNKPVIPPRTRTSIRRDRAGANERLMQDYFAEVPTYPSWVFRRRFRMRRELFMRIVDDIKSYSVDPLPSHFTNMRQHFDGRGRIGFTTIQKCASAIRQLAYGTCPDALDEYLQIGETMARESLYDFCKCVYELYSEEYLRKPTLQDIQRLQARHAEMHGFPGMLGNIDCMHCPWRNCPTAWQGQFTRSDHDEPTIMLEVVASEIIEDTAPDTSFTVNGSHYQKGYYLADGIYPEWATFVKSFMCPRDDKKRKFKLYQERARKDVDLAFGVLQGRWGIIRQPARAYSINKIRRIMYTCVILNNMIVVDSGNAISQLEEDYVSEPHNLPTQTFHERCTIHQRTNKELCKREVHHGLRRDLVEHIWSLP